MDMGMMNGADFVERVRDALKKKGVSVKQFYEDLGIAKTALTTWGIRGASPSADVTYRIARYLDTTVEFLLTGENVGDYTETVSRIASKVSRLPPEYQTFIERQADMYLDALAGGAGLALADVPDDVREVAYEIAALPKAYQEAIFYTLDGFKRQCSAPGTARISDAG